MRGAPTGQFPRGRSSAIMCSLPDNAMTRLDDIRRARIHPAESAGRGSCARVNTATTSRARMIASVPPGGVREDCGDLLWSFRAAAVAAVRAAGEQAPAAGRPHGRRRRLCAIGRAHSARRSDGRRAAILPARQSVVISSAPPSPAYRASRRASPRRDPSRRAGRGARSTARLRLSPFHGAPRSPSAARRAGERAADLFPSRLPMAGLPANRRAPRRPGEPQQPRAGDHGRAAANASASPSPAPQLPGAWTPANCAEPPGRAAGRAPT